MSSGLRELRKGSQAISIDSRKMFHLCQDAARFFSVSPVTAVLRASSQATHREMIRLRVAEVQLKKTGEAEKVQKG